MSLCHCGSLSQSLLWLDDCSKKSNDEESMNRTIIT